MMTKSYTLYIDAYSPDTIPMGRLALYMQNFATLLGNSAAVHFDTLRSGSTQLAVKIDHEDVPKVAVRLDLIRRGDGAPDGARAQVEIDRLLAEDNATGFIYEDRNQSTEIITFPGVTRLVAETYGPFKQEGSLDGVLISVGGADQTAHIMLQNGEIKYSGIETTRDIARRLAKHMYEPVRLFGTGNWMREASGSWILKKFRLESFAALQTDSLKVAVDQLRQVEGSNWKAMDDPIQALKSLRDGTNGVH